MLVPTAILVLLLLAAMAVDGAVAYLGQRQLGNALASAANDAAGAGLDPAAYYGSGLVVLDPAATVAAVCASLATQPHALLHALQVEVGVSGAAVEVAGRAQVDAVFGSPFPGWGVRTVTASATADAAQAPGPPAPPPSNLEPVTC